MSKLLDPDLMHVLFAIAGAVFGWWIKRGIPDDLAGIVKLLVARHQAGKQADAHETLQALALPPKEAAK